MAHNVTLRFFHKISVSDKDVEGPFIADNADFRDLASARKWFDRERGVKLGRVDSWRMKGKNFLIFPGNGSYYSIWNAIEVENAISDHDPAGPKRTRHRSTSRHG